MGESNAQEYGELRATIRTRGTARVWIFVTGLIAWAALVVAVSALVQVPAAALVPLLILVATFEAVFALHAGVERIGRYLQVFHDDRWEHASMTFGRPLAGTRSDPLFVVPFALATLLNYLPVIGGDAVGVERAAIALAHLAFLGRLTILRRQTARQRPADLARFQQIKDATRSN
jgi:hypothetical protein